MSIHGLWPLCPTRAILSAYERQASRSPRTARHAPPITQYAIRNTHNVLGTAYRVLRIAYHDSRITHYALRFAFYPCRFASHRLWPGGLRPPTHRAALARLAGDGRHPYPGGSTRIQRLPDRYRLRRTAGRVDLRGSGRDGPRWELLPQAGAGSAHRRRDRERPETARAVLPSAATTCDLRGRRSAIQTTV